MSRGGRQGGRDRRGSGGGKGRSSRRSTRRRNRQRTDVAAFWGDASKLPPTDAEVRLTDDPTAVPRSLGAPPLPRQRAVAEHYFALVYDRAVTIAAALAAAGGLIRPEELTGERGADGDSGSP